LEAIRLTGLEITELTDDLTDGIQNTGQIAKEMHSSLSQVKHQARQATVTTKSVFAGFRAAWQTLTTDTTSAADRISPTAPNDAPEQDVLPVDLGGLSPTRSSRATFPVHHQRSQAELVAEDE
jgi:deoxyribodipyrimidine photolyase